MKKDEFWKLYNEKYKNKMQPGVAIADYPLGSDCGIFIYSCFENENGVWCIEKTRERCNTPYHDEYESEDEAFDYFLSIVHSHSTEDGFYISQQNAKRKHFEADFMEQINGSSGMYEYSYKWPGAKTVYTFKMKCFKVYSGKWKLEVDNGAGRCFFKEYDTLEEAKEEAYKNY